MLSSSTDCTSRAACKDQAVPRRASSAEAPSVTSDCNDGCLGPSLVQVSHDCVSTLHLLLRNALLHCRTTANASQCWTPAAVSKGFESFLAQAPIEVSQTHEHLPDMHKCLAIGISARLSINAWPRNACRQTGNWSRCSSSSWMPNCIFKHWRKLW